MLVGFAVVGYYTAYGFGVDYCFLWFDGVLCLMGCDLIVFEMGLYVLYGSLTLTNLLVYGVFFRPLWIA